MTRTDKQQSLAANCHAEVVELHQFFQDWFNGDIPATAENLARLTVALDDNFTLIDPDGKVTARQPLLDRIAKAHQSRQGFKIWIEQFQRHYHSGDIILVSYQEWQQPHRSDRITARISTALFKKESGAPNGVRWLHAHETWLET